MGLYDDFSTCAVCAGMQLTTEMIATRYVDQSPALVCEQCASERNIENQQDALEIAGVGRA